jgi:hypothetical protein
MATDTTITRQAPYIEALGEQYGKDLTALTAKAMPTATYAPTVAGQDPAQQAAYTMATTQGQGIGAYQPYITQAGAYQTQAAGLTGTGAGTGVGSIASYMSPYQQQVINETLKQYDLQAQKGLAGIGTRAAMSGNLGGGIQQAQTQAVLDAQREANRMAAYEPYERLGYMGAGLGNILGGMQGQYQTTIRPDPTPLQSALGILSTGLGAYQAFNK